MAKPRLVAAHHVKRFLHVHVNPPGEWRGAQSANVTQGVLRVTRTGIRVRGYLDAALLFETDLNAEDVRVKLHVAEQRNP